MPANEEQDGESSREVEFRRSAREILDIYFSRLYHQVASSSRERYYLSSL